MGTRQKPPGSCQMHRDPYLLHSQPLHHDCSVGESRNIYTAQASAPGTVPLTIFESILLHTADADGLIIK
ncbi:hypothetical protein DNTS_033195 [Danionella cerebrum]|uniref:Uncharacterized protein n=1 Tax=Danionella cerebrum TaxID=2873325 RepID=A0A553NKZ1_9TELE|nr:hypothetical protein DNTS_033195 [Danionella translucida]